MTMTPDPDGSPAAPPRRPVETRPMTPLEKRMVEDLQWACQAFEVQQHEGQLVVVRNKRVLAVGLDEPNMVKEAAAREGCPEHELVVVVVPRFDLQEIPR